MKEFVVWGVAPKKTEEEPLFTRAKTLTEAKEIAEILTQKHGCTRTRIQVIDFNECLAKQWREVIK